MRNKRHHEHFTCYNLNESSFVSSSWRRVAPRKGGQAVLMNALSRSCHRHSRGSKIESHTVFPGKRVVPRLTFQHTAMAAEWRPS